MGVCAQQHRVVTGCFAASLQSSIQSAPRDYRKDRGRRSKVGRYESGARKSFCQFWQILVILLTVTVNTAFMVVVPPLLLSTAQIMTQTGHGSRLMTMQFTSSTSYWMALQYRQELTKPTWQEEELPQVWSTAGRTRMPCKCLTKFRQMRPLVNIVNFFIKISMIFISRYLLLMATLRGWLIMPLTTFLRSPVWSCSSTTSSIAWLLSML